MTLGVDLHAEPDDRPIDDGPDLDQVANVVDQPEAARVTRVWSGTFAVRQRPVVQAAVANLHHQIVGVAPHPEGSLASTVQNAVRGDLVDRAHELRRAPGAQPGGGRVARDLGPQAEETVAIEANRLHSGLRLGEWRVERRPARHDTAELPADMHLAAFGHVRVAATCFLDHRFVELIDVVGAQQPPRLTTVESNIEKRLVVLTFDQLVSWAAIPDRLADTT